MLLSLLMTSIEKGVIGATFRICWKFFFYCFAPVFVFKQIVSLVALFDSAKNVIEFDEEERAHSKKE